MTSRLLAAAVLTALLALPASAQGKNFPYPYKSQTRSHGLLLVHRPFNAPRLLAFYTVVPVPAHPEMIEVVAAGSVMEK